MNEFQPDTVMRDIDTITPYAKNTKLHPDEQIAKLASMIAEFGWDQPIVIDKDGIIIKGHGRRLAALRLNLKQVPVVVRTDLSKAQVMAARIADNRVAESGWDTSLLSMEFSELKDMEFDLDLLGFDADELDKILEPTQAGTDGLTDPDAIPEKVDTRCKPGDIWILGNHRVMCGDSTNVQHVERLMAGEKADMVFTDPPYGIDLDTDLSNIKAELKGWKGAGGKYSKVIGDDEPYDPGFILGLFQDVPEIFLWGADYYAERLIGKNDGCWFAWDKTTNEGGGSVSWNLGSMFELCWSKSKHKREVVRKLWAGLYGTETQDVRSRIHPTQKPNELCQWFINKFSKDGQLVVDLFLGSGSTLIACEKTGRRCFGMEIDPHYCDVILKRWEDFTGKQAERELDAA
jgi:DNA modification methylase